MTYNIRHGMDMNLQGQADLIKKYDVDLLALEEVDQDVARSGKIDQPEFFSKNLTVKNGIWIVYELWWRKVRYCVLLQNVAFFRERIMVPRGTREPRAFPLLKTTIGLQVVIFVAVYFDSASNDDYRKRQT